MRFYLALCAVLNYSGDQKQFFPRTRGEMDEKTCAAIILQKDRLQCIVEGINQTSEPVRLLKNPQQISSSRPPRRFFRSFWRSLAVRLLHARAIDGILCDDLFQ